MGKNKKNREFVCTATAIVDHEYIYEGQEYRVNKDGLLVMDDGFILRPKYKELEKYGYFK